MTDQLRFGVAGAGKWGRNLIRNCAELGALRVVSDPDESALAEISVLYPYVKTTAFSDAMLQSDIDAVIIAAPAHLHADLAIRSMMAGKHVFVEKPLALTIADAERVLQTSRATGKKCFVGHVLLYHPAAKKMLELAKNGAIGMLRHARCRRLSWGRVRSRENVWWSFAPHDAALCLELFEEMPVETRVWHHDFVREGVSDVAYGELLFSGGRLAHIEVGWLDPNKTSRIDVFGSSGVLSMIDGTQGAELTLRRCGVIPERFGRDNMWQEDQQHVTFPREEPLKNELLAFSQWLREGIVPPTDIEEGVRVVRALSVTRPERTQSIMEELPA